jgi:hypothetical protein
VSAIGTSETPQTSFEAIAGTRMSRTPNPYRKTGAAGRARRTPACRDVDQAYYLCLGRPAPLTPTLVADKHRVEVPIGMHRHHPP